MVSMRYMYERALLLYSALLLSLSCAMFGVAPEVKQGFQKGMARFIPYYAANFPFMQSIDEKLQKELAPLPRELDRMLVTRAPKILLPERDEDAVIILPAPASSTEEFSAPVQEDEESAEEEALPNYAYLGQFLKPWEYVSLDRSIEINFENAEIINLIRYFEQQYGLTFILDDIIKPPEPGARQVTGVKFSFKTERPLNRKEAWDIFVKFLDIAGLMVIPGPADRVFLITNNSRTSTFSTSRDPVPTFIGIDYTLLPSSDIKIRYVYFIQHTTSNNIKTVVDNLKSTIAAPPIIIEDLNALILTDRATNIRSILAILKELDKPILPETLTIIKLQTADATRVKALYDSLVKEETSLLARLNPGGRKQSSVTYFTENVRVIADQRTNSLILLGPRINVEKIEQFIRREIDKDIDLPYSPLHVYALKYIDAEATAQIINELKGFQPENAVGATQFGGVIGGIKFLKPTVTITAEKSTNSLIVNADYDDYLQIYDLLQKIDTEQPQVAIRTLVLNVTWTDNRSLGIQFRNRVPTLNGALGDTNGGLVPNINFQTSGLLLNGASAGLVLNTTVPPNNTGAERLLGNLVNLASGNTPGSTVVTLGADAFGVWGIFKVLQAFSNISIVAKPFLVTTHKYRAKIAIEEIRHVTTSTIVGGSNVDVPTFGDLTAGLTLEITPQISPDGLITLVVSVESSSFSLPAANAVDPSAAPSQGDRNVKRIDTSVIVEDNQVLALGGLTQDVVSETEYKVPILGDVPILGWFFKNRRKAVAKASLLILISAEIINPHARRRIEQFTNNQMTEAQQLLDEMMCDEQLKDPIHDWFFEDNIDPIGARMRSFNTNPDATQVAAVRARKERRMRGRRRPPPGAVPPPPYAAPQIPSEPPATQVSSRGRRSVRGRRSMQGAEAAAMVPPQRAFSPAEAPGDYYPAPAPVLTTAAQEDLKVLDALSQDYGRQMAGSLQGRSRSLRDFVDESQSGDSR